MNQELQRILAKEKTVTASCQLDFVFSVVIVGHNMQRHLAEAIESVMVQSVGFADGCIQIVLVDDGSTDETGTICARYARRYPSCIQHVSQERRGAAAGRVAGLKSARGLWVNFMDPEGVWTAHALEAVLRFHGAHPQVGIVSLWRVPLGESSATRNLEAPLFCDQVVDVFENPSHPQRSLAQLFVRCTLMQRAQLEEYVGRSCEHAAVAELVLHAQRFGMARDGAYRSHTHDESLAQRALVSADSDAFERLGARLRCSYEVLARAKAQYGEVVPYLQYCIAADALELVREGMLWQLSTDQRRVAEDALKDVLSLVDDQALVCLRTINPTEALEMLSLKYGTPVSDILASTVRVGKAWYAGAPETPVEVHPAGIPYPVVVLDRITAGTGFVRLEGYNPHLGGDCVGLVHMRAVADGAFYEVCFESLGEAQVSDSVQAVRPRRFSVDVPWEAPQELGIYLQVLFGDETYPARLKFRSPCGLAKDFRNAYWVHGPLTLTFEAQTEGDQLLVAPTTRARSTALEAKLQIEMTSRFGRVEGAKICLQRTLGCELRRKRESSGSQLWLIADQHMWAGGLGEALFAYLGEHPLKDVSPVFVLASSSPDWRRLAQMDNVVAFGSPEHQRALLRANLLILSSEEEDLRGAFGERSGCLADLADAPSVLLRQADASGEHHQREGIPANNSCLDTHNAWAAHEVSVDERAASCWDDVVRQLRALGETSA